MVYTYQGLSFSVDKEHWVSKDWQEDPQEKTIASQVASLIKRSKAHRFYGLMGKRSGNKGDLLGLMSRGLRSGSLPRIHPDDASTAINVADGSHTEPDSQEEWDKLQYQ
ncbi:hypothetical protein DPEC_G00360030 [Dallia pectoralis]|uniref:Uncharacterized protein n=1 Tax=Dallia pectoralis TaxID=75939 RepID=A0ACC2F0T6_DALPE|nr:hypothetical protein DPEC_G00360030 [Dallia pectoralis]